MNDLREKLAVLLYKARYPTQKSYLDLSDQILSLLASEPEEELTLKIAKYLSPCGWERVPDNQDDEPEDCRETTKGEFLQRAKEIASLFRLYYEANNALKSGKLEVK
jgi:hypothetical protein